MSEQPPRPLVERWVRVRGTSMLPGIAPGKILRFAPLPPSGPKRGDLILLRPLGGASRPLLKRVVGLPLERIELRGVRVFVNGQPLEEPYVDPRAGLQPVPDRIWTLASCEYVVLGDARDDSLDSRAFGPIVFGDILGAAACEHSQYSFSP